MSFENVYAVILAGGSGTRFWPQSRRLLPKQLCKIASTNKTMLQQTLERLDGAIPPERRIVVTHKDQALLTRKIVGNTSTVVLEEPEAKNTAAALAFAAMYIEGLGDTSSTEKIMISLHADHVIRETERLIQDLKLAVEVSRLEKLTLIGVDPTYPATSYGYIKLGETASHVQSHSAGYYSCEGFKEKPNFEIAVRYLESGRYLWNTGIFVWKTQTMLLQLAEFHPEYAAALEFMLTDSDINSETFKRKLTSAYASLPSRAIDHALLERSSRLAVLKASFTWFDVGSWDSLKGAVTEPDQNGNILRGKNIFIKDVKGCVVSCDDDSVVAAIGVSNLVISNFRGATLVVPLERCQEVKDVVEELGRRGLSSFI